MLLKYINSTKEEKDMEKKAIFFDIDGTIYSYDKGVIKDTGDAIRELRANGHLAFLCTGRTYPMVTDDIRNIGFDGVIAGGGTYIEFGNEVLFKKEIETDITNSVIECMRKNGIMPIPEGHKYLYFEMEDKIKSVYRKAYDTYMRSIPDRIRLIDMGEVRAAKVSGAFDDNSNIDSVIKEMEREFRYVIHNEKLLELIPRDYSKAEGIKLLINEIGIKWENTYAYGDSFNDLEMLKYVKHGVAMGNSHKDLFEMVEYRTGDYDKGGIRESLERFGLL